MIGDFITHLFAAASVIIEQTSGYSLPVFSTILATEVSGIILITIIFGLEFDRLYFIRYRKERKGQHYLCRTTGVHPVHDFMQLFHHITP